MWTNREVQTNKKLIYLNVCGFNQWLAILGEDIDKNMFPRQYFGH